jgi:hypothetical protein
MGKMNNRLPPQPILIKPYTRSLWHALMELRRFQLAEAGIFVPLEDMEDQPHNVGRDEYEWDYHHNEERKRLNH